jgi:PIN domain nuclease of toxin-antitoxin system
LLDTHIWFWYLIGSHRLSDGSRDAIDGAIGRLWLSPISVWELGMLVARGRIEMTVPLRDLVMESHLRLPTEEAAITREVALRCHEIELSHRDPADFLIAACALVYDLTLVTADERLTGLDWLPTLRV